MIKKFLTVGVPLIPALRNLPAQLAYPPNLFGDLTSSRLHRKTKSPGLGSRSKDGSLRKFEAWPMKSIFPSLCPESHSCTDIPVCGRMLFQAQDHGRLWQHHPLSVDREGTHRHCPSPLCLWPLVNSRTTRFCPNFLLLKSYGSFHSLN